MKSFLSGLAPNVVLLVLGAVVTGLLVPHITMSWQNQQKALDLKTSLVTRLSNAATKLIVATQIEELGTAGAESQADIYGAYRDWAIESAALGSELAAYFPHTTIGTDWNSYSDLVTNFYALLGVQNTRARANFLQTIRHDLLPMRPKNVDWRALTKWNGVPLQSPHVQAVWYMLRTDVLKRKNPIIEAVLNAHIASY